jgi:anti-sigma factor ChrR (cupin superfamily)
VTRHVDAETLARYREGDLRGWRGWRIRAHLSRCAECRALSAELAEVTTMLASVSTPPMPDYLSARIQGALAHEAALRSVVDSSIPHPATGTAERPPQQTASPVGRDLGRPRRQRPARDWVPRWSGLGAPAALRVATAAAAVAVLVVGGYEVADHTGGSSSPSASSPRRESAPARLAPPVSYGPALRYQHSGQVNSVTAITTNTDFTAGQLDGQVEKLSSYETSPGAAPNRSFSPSVPSNTSGTFRNIPVVDMSGCINRMAAGGLVVLVDVAAFQGTPALVILTEVSQTAQKHIWVVGTGCSATRSDILDQGVLPAGS